MTLHEFDIINRFFAKETLCRNDVIVGIGDDGAIVTVPHDNKLAITTDTLVSGIHFPHNTTPYDIGYKALAVNLSDLAAIGAIPSWFTLALTLPEADETWLTPFCKGMFGLAKQYNMQLIGGDLTRGPLTITIAAYGFVPKNQILRRSAAMPGDLIYVTNTIGDAALGLRIVEQKISVKAHYQDDVLTRLNRPEPRVNISYQIRDVVNAVIDISDGLAADLTHILEQSHVGAILYIDQLPLSNALRNSVSFDEAISMVLNGGDDYELCFTVPKEKQNQLPSSTTCIGIIVEKPGLDLRFKNGNPYKNTAHGYQHF